jgi:hypothetical protein
VIHRWRHRTAQKQFRDIGRIALDNGGRELSGGDRRNAAGIISPWRRWWSRIDRYVERPLVDDDLARIAGRRRAGGRADGAVSVRSIAAF